VLADSAYTLSGTLTEGTSVITAEYQGLTDTFNVANVVDWYNITSWEYPGLVDVWSGSALRNNFDGTVHLYLSPGENRRTVVVDRGIAPFKDYQGLASSYYPIPFPESATKAIISVTPNTLGISPSLWQWYEQESRYVRAEDPGYSGYGSVTFTPGSRDSRPHFLCVNFKKSDNSAFDSSDVPTSITIEFE
jgi:hypothetical protein